MKPLESYGKGSEKTIIKSNGMTAQLVDLVKNFYKVANNEKKGKREIREIYHMMKGTLFEQPEYIKRKQHKEKNRSRRSHSSLDSNKDKS